MVLAMGDRWCCCYAVFGSAADTDRRHAFECGGTLIQGQAASPIRGLSLPKPLVPFEFLNIVSVESCRLKSWRAYEVK